MAGALPRRRQGSGMWSCRDVGLRRMVVVGVVAALWAQLASVTVEAGGGDADGGSVACGSGCVDAGSLPFCGALPYQVCGDRSHVELLVADAAANASVFEVLQSSDSTPSLAGVGEECGGALKQLACAVQFPVCADDDIAFVCTAECGEATEDCEAQGIVAGDVCQGHTTTSVNCFVLPFQNGSGAWVAGFTIAVVFSFLSTLGINMQKMSMRLDKEANRTRSPFRQPWWLAGFLLICSGSLLDFVAFALAPQTKLAPLGSLSLVWNIVIAPRFHDEVITRRNVIATLVIGLGVTSTVAFSTQKTPTYNLDWIMTLFQQASFIVYALVTVGTLTSLYLLARYIERHNKPWPLMHVVCYGGLGGIFGGQSVLLAKIVVELVKSALLEGGDAFEHVIMYVLIASMAACLLSQISFLNSGLRKFDALRVVPTYQAFWITASVLGGEFFFDEYLSLNGTQMLMFVLGVVVTVVGIAVLLFRPKPGEVDPMDTCCSWIVPVRPTAAASRREYSLANMHASSSAGDQDDDADDDADDDDDDDGIELVRHDGNAAAATAATAAVAASSDPSSLWRASETPNSMDSDDDVEHHRRVHGTAVLATAGGHGSDRDSGIDVDMGMDVEQ